MTLDSRTLRLIAGAAGASEKAVQRIVGSIRIEAVKPSTESPQRFELGIHIPPKEVRVQGNEQAAAALTQIVREYRNACPIVVGWIGRGDFDPKKIPAEINFAHVLHASRTAGRLRAKFLRKFSCQVERDKL